MTSNKPESSAAQAEEQAPPSRSSMRELFPGYFPPSENAMMVFITRGLVVFDTNALLSMYRFTEQARNEYLGTLRLLEDRLWVPNHVGYEFFNNRDQVIRDCAAANDTLATALDVPFNEARRMIDAFASYRGLSGDETKQISQILDEAAAQILDKLNQIYSFSIDPDADLDSDPILHEIETLLDGKIGPAFAEKDAIRAASEGTRRVNNNIPPGYADKHKGESKSIGDYLLWTQTIDEARRRQLPVLLVTNDEKEDWVHRSSGRSIGPRTELVLEMQEKANQKFHLVTVQTFLLHAKKYLSANVSDATVHQAASSRHSDEEEEDVDAGSTDQPVNPIDRNTLASQLAGSNFASRYAAQMAASQIGADTASRLASQLAAGNAAARLAAQFSTLNPASQLAAQLAANSPTTRLAAQIGTASTVDIRHDEGDEDADYRPGDEDAERESLAEE